MDVRTFKDKLTLNLILSSAENVCNRFGSRRSGLISIKPVWHSDSIPERILVSHNF